MKRCRKCSHKQDPGIKIEHFQNNPEPLVQRIIAESQAGKPAAVDVIQSGSLRALRPLIDRDRLVSYSGWEKVWSGRGIRHHRFLPAVASYLVFVPLVMLLYASGKSTEGRNRNLTAGERVGDGSSALHDDRLPPENCLSKSIALALPDSVPSIANGTGVSRIGAYNLTLPNGDPGARLVR